MSSIKDDGNNNNNKKKKKNSLGAPSSPSNSTSNGSTGTVTATQPQPKPAPANKRKRNLPGTPDPRAEVVALSPDSLMATNRFVCEICNKGFQRDQNLQLHRRGHNLPWKLKQRTTGEVRKRVYVCPEPSCVHHHPARALGDLTGIKKHFSRKHGEKNWNCDKCSKKYAVQSDWKAHLKICGTKEYKCECGTIFSRRDSFMTHRAFCEALIEENRLANNEGLSLNQQMGQVSDLLVGSSASDQETENPLLPHHQHQQVLLPLPAMPSPKPFIINNNNTTAAPAAGSSIFQSSGYASLSATALLQKAAQMGATANNNGVAIGSNDSNNMMAMMMMMNSSMAPPSFGAPPPPPARVDDMSSSQFFGNVNNHQGSSSAMNDMGMFYRFLDQNNAAALMKKLERESTGSNNNETGGGSKNVLHGNMNGMTVDFMGIGGSRTRNNIHDPHQQQQQQSIVGQQQQQPRAIQSFNQFQQQQDVPFFN